ncbi:unnamed protein product [Ostreobium quekettii]|uniref:non-specific serine/threonine protein kinase n=1 Tax=Ostreobium quekettii TaxID=121088 RepID=A0A8S1IQC7_9CHLO|nr:unnamed protein product [Ostreobium quekettii]
MDNYHVIDLVGEGSFGKVYKGRRRCTGQITAMKFIMKHGKSEKDIRNLRQEIEILRHLRHENIIQMLDTFETKSDFCVVTGGLVSHRHLPKLYKSELRCDNEQR